MSDVPTYGEIAEALRNLVAERSPETVKAALDILKKIGYIPK